MLRPKFLLIVIFILVVLLGVLAGYAQQQAMKSAEGPQRAFTAVPVKDGKLWVKPDDVVVFELRPVGDNHYAPVEGKSKLLCRQYELTDENNEHHIAYRCGADLYLLKSMNIIDAQEWKKAFPKWEQEEK